MLGSRLAIGLALATTLVGAGAQGQERPGPYEQFYGSPVDVPLADLARGTVPFGGKPVRTRGVVDVYSEPGASLSARSRAYVLRDEGFSVLLLPVPEIAADWEFAAPTQLGRRLEVTGHYRSSSDSSTLGPSGVLEFWSYAQAPRGGRRKARAKATTLEALLSRPERWKGQRVAVAGEFRGTNLFGDLPSSTQRHTRDWVLRDGERAVWITGRPPRGDGFRLDPALRRDTGKWLEVTGRVEVERDAVYLKASSIALVARPVRRPAPPAEPRPEPPAPEQAPDPPHVVFSLPLDGEAGIARDSTFVLQFSKDMDASTFSGRVALRYAGPEQVGDPGFGRLAVTYDDGLRALTIDPGVALRPGRIVELALLPGIKDLDGVALATRPGRSAGDAAEILRFRVGP